MGRLTIYKDNHADVTAVSNIFIDEYMKDANDAQLKVYLYLLRMTGANLPTGISDLADKFNHTEKDVLRALKYWEKNGLLALEYDRDGNLSGIRLLEPYRLEPEKKAEAGTNTKTDTNTDTKTDAKTDTKINAPAKTEAEPEETIPDKPLAPVVSLVSRPAAAEPDPYTKPSYTLDQLKAFQSDEETSQLLFIVEQYIGKTLTPSEIKTVFFLSDRLGFSVDLIDYLVQYCLERGKKDFRYIEKVAVSWAQQNITTPEQAEKQTYKYDRIVYDIMKALGKSSAPTAKEVDFIRRWTKVFGYGMDVISVACERTVLGTDKHRFEYADSILNSWFRGGVRHAGDIAGADESFKRTKPVPTRTGAANKFNQFAQNSYDFDALEKELLRN